MPTNIGSADRNVGGSRTSDQGDSSGGQPRPPSRMRYVKGGSTRDIPVPESVIAYLLTYTKEVLPSIAGKVTPETALFWSTWGRRVVGRTRQPMTGKNLWRLTKFYGRAIGVPELKPHDLRHGVAMEMYGKHGDLEKVRALLGHQRIDTTQVYASIRPTQLRRSVEFLGEKASRMLRREAKPRSVFKDRSAMSNGTSSNMER